jgi:WD40 repeat protein
VQLWDATTRAWKQTFEGHTRPVNAVAFSPDGKVLTRKDRLQPPQQTTLSRPCPKAIDQEGRHKISFFDDASYFSKVEKTQDFVLHGNQLRQMSGYFASFTEWSKRFELVTCEDGCWVSLISGDGDISANNNTPEAQNSD